MSERLYNGKTLADLVQIHMRQPDGSDHWYVIRRTDEEMAEMAAKSAGL